MENTTMKNIMDMMDDEMSTIKADLHEAKMAFADITLEDGDYQCRNDRKIACKEFEAQLRVMRKMKDQIMCMADGMTKTPALARM